MKNIIKKERSCQDHEEKGEEGREKKKEKRRNLMS